MQWREISSESEKKKSIMAVAPSDIRGSVFQTVWIVPDTLVHKGVVMSRLLTTRMFAKLQQLTGCAMAISGNGRYMYIGAESEGQLLMAEHKLTTLAKYAVSFIVFYMSMTNRINLTFPRQSPLRLTIAARALSMQRVDKIVSPSSPTWFTDQRLS